MTRRQPNGSTPEVSLDAGTDAVGDRETVWFFTPVYCDVESFRVLRTRLREVLGADRASREREVRFVVIDDSAGADTEVDDLSELSDIVVVRAPFNLGHQRAIVYGIRCLLPSIADADVVVTLDADGEDSPDDVLRLLEPLAGTGVSRRDVVLARRTKRQESLKFRAWYVMFRLLFRTLTGVVVRTGNFAAYRGWLAKRILLHPGFDLCYSSTFYALDVRIRHVPCARARRIAGRSRMNTSRLLLHGLRMLMPFLDRIALRALLLFSTVFGLSVVLSAVVLAVRFFTDYAIPGWATSTLLLAVIASSVALGNFVVLFAIFSQSRGISLSGLESGFSEHTGEVDVDRSARESSHPTTR